MQDYAEKVKLLKQIDTGLADIQKVEEEIASVRLALSNSVKRFQLSPRMAVTNTSMIAFRQRLVKLFDSYMELESKVYSLIKAVDRIEP